MKKRAWKRTISTLLIVCMLAGVAPVTQMQQVEAFDILGIVERMGCVVRGGMNAYETAKEKNWDAGEAFFGTFKNIGTGSTDFESTVAFKKASSLSIISFNP